MWELRFFVGKLLFLIYGFLTKPRPNFSGQMHLCMIEYRYIRNDLTVPIALFTAAPTYFGGGSVSLLFWLTRKNICFVTIERAK
jgi:hypothetical protein